jgi:phosphoribosyl 1,2-cyclic phosphodiesterase
MHGFCPLASGSKGNCIYLGTHQTKILIDAGISGRAIIQRLNQINVDITEIDAIIVTHEHFDHIQGLKVLTKKYQIPVFCNLETAKGICESLKIQPNFKIFTTNENFIYKDIAVKPFGIKHDTLDPVAICISYDQLKIGICTDLGVVTSQVIRYLQDCDYLYIEANHHPDLVLASLRPAVYKKRVLGKFGHLSNQECVYLLSNIFSKRLKHVFLAHLSKECNKEELALNEVNNFFKLQQYQIEVSIAKQDMISDQIKFQSEILKPSKA